MLPSHYCHQHVSSPYESSDQRGNYYDGDSCPQNYESASDNPQSVISMGTIERLYLLP